MFSHRSGHLRKSFLSASAPPALPSQPVHSVSVFHKIVDFAFCGSRQEQRVRWHILVPLQTPRSSGVGQPLNFYPPASLNFLSLAASAPLRLAKIEGASLEYLGSLKWNQYIPEFLTFAFRAFLAIFRGRFLFYLLSMSCETSSKSDSKMHQKSNIKNSGVGSSKNVFS